MLTVGSDAPAPARTPRQPALGFGRELSALRLWHHEHVASILSANLVNSECTRWAWAGESVFRSAWPPER